MSLTEKPLVLELSTLGKKSSLRKYLSILNENESYRSCFKEGADLMPRKAVIVDILGTRKQRYLVFRCLKSKRLILTINGVSISKAELNLNLFLLRSNQM
jgi:hypothetical protein